ncbi:unnamed protein product [Peniophora sp. CBMAI 1063]|nr:unnamed protein product [Peniophora sp. CBMAI 1063]
MTGIYKDTKTSLHLDSPAAVEDAVVLLILACIAGSIVSVFLRSIISAIREEYGQEEQEDFTEDELEADEPEIDVSNAEEPEGEELKTIPLHAYAPHLSLVASTTGYENDTPSTPPLELVQRVAPVAAPEEHTDVTSENRSPQTNTPGLLVRSTPSRNIETDPTYTNLFDITEDPFDNILEYLDADECDCGCAARIVIGRERAACLETTEKTDNILRYVTRGLRKNCEDANGLAHRRERIYVDLSMEIRVCDAEIERLQTERAGRGAK